MDLDAELPPAAAAEVGEAEESAALAAIALELQKKEEAKKRRAERFGTLEVRFINY